MGIFLCANRHILLEIKILSLTFSCYYQAFTLKLELIGIDFLWENESITTEGYFLCGNRDIVLDIEKYAFTVVGIKSLLPIFFLLLPGIYIQIGISWKKIVPPWY